MSAESIEVLRDQSQSPTPSRESDIDPKEEYAEYGVSPSSDSDLEIFLSQGPEIDEPKDPDLLNVPRIIVTMPKGSGLFNVIRTEETCDEGTPLLNGSDRKGMISQYLFVNRDEDTSSSRPSTPDHDRDQEEKPRYKKILNNIKIALLTLAIIFSVVSLSFIKEKEDHWLTIAVKEENPVSINLSERIEDNSPILYLKVGGNFLPEKYENFTDSHLFFSVVSVDPNGTHIPIVRPWIVPIPAIRLFNEVEPTILEHTFDLSDIEFDENTEDNYQIFVSTNEDDDFVPITLDFSLHPELSVDSIVMATSVLVGLYILIIFDLVHRTLAAMIGATVAISFLALVGERPTLEKVLSWLDVETLCLLFGMMVLVSILCETGFFDYTAVLAYRLARGRMWPLLTTLCLLTAVLSAFLDNVTTILLTTAITIRLCEVMNVDPKHVLIALVLFSNIGGAATPVGDPPNVIIISNKAVADAGVDFASFTFHAVPNIALCLVGSYLLIRIMYRDVSSMRFKDPPEVVELHHEIDVWKKAYQSLSGYSRDEYTVRRILKKKVHALENLLRKKLYDIRPSDEYYKESLKELKARYKIRNETLLLKSGLVIAFVIVFFFLQSIPQLNLSLGWIAILGALLLLVLADFDELEGIFGRVEWSTLLFFAALFVVMEALAQLRLLWYIGQMTQDWISSVSEDQRLTVAILIILWVSALASSFIDNIPFTTVMVQIVSDIANNDDLDLPITPLVYALAFGACLGGNGTLIGASANVVCAGLAEQHGYRFTFMDFFKIGFPVMLLTTVISMAYLLVCHVVLEWNT